LRVAGAGSIREQEVGEVLGKHVSSSGGERVCAIHCLLVFDTDRDDVALGHGLEDHLVMGRHHVEGLLDAQVKGAAHVLGNMPPEGT
jgi:hypothetical protein